MARRKRTPVGTPLTPDLLVNLGAIDELGRYDGDFDPQRSHINLYRIWTCHGYHESGNQNRGYLRIERQSSDLAGTIAYKISQKILNDHGFLHCYSASILCRNDELSSLIKWNLHSQFFGPDREIIPDLETKETDTAESYQQRMNTGIGTALADGDKNLTADWCLFDAVQRLSVNPGLALEFNMLEEMTMFRKNHRLRYDEQERLNISDESRQLFRFYQYGQGTLPTEYWLDIHQRLILAVNFSVAYILDDQAEELLQGLIVDQRN